MKKKTLGIISTSKDSSEEVQTSGIKFVDDGVFCSNGVESESKIQETEDYCATMHSATGGNFQKEEIVMRNWKLKPIR